MLTRKLITRVVWTRGGVEKWQAEVNAHFAKGWEPVAIEMDKMGFRISCFALLSMPTRCDCQCSCCTGQSQHGEDCDCACDCCVVHSNQAKKAIQEED